MHKKGNSCERVPKRKVGEHTNVYAYLVLPRSLNLYKITKQLAKANCPVVEEKTKVDVGYNFWIHL
ncbi:hypothetical protein ATL10_10367 [Bacillus sp. 196mf]|nr:hypothetical protein ATL10_10367 [Bacillus sp. 196mf]